MRNVDTKLDARPPIAKRAEHRGKPVVRRVTLRRDTDPPPRGRELPLDDVALEGVHLGKDGSRDLRKLLTTYSPFRFVEMHERTFTRYIGRTRLHDDDALPMFVSVTRLRDRAPVLFNVRDVKDPLQLLLASNFLPPFYVKAPIIDGEKYGDGATWAFFAIVSVVAAILGAVAARGVVTSPKSEGLAAVA